MAPVPFAVKSVETRGSFCTLTAIPKKKFKFSAGQFAKVRIAPASTDFVVLSFYSGEADEDVKFLFNLDGGTVKGQLAKLKEGGLFYAEGPFGIFTLRGTRSPKVFFAKKMGITPLCSMVRTLVSKKSRPPIYIFSENLAREDIPEEEGLRECARGKGVFLLISLLNQQPLNWDGKLGEFDADDITKYVKDYGKAEYYICGPVPFVNRMRAVLDGLRVQDRNVFFEQWGQ
ncbi:MAG: FAD-dependent oxidoreductase [Candidatus ainarchaeum sp.]|nr:FAD-dependent oxidoreductase [Candidatus ainarchaeum sp.]MDD5096351.1 FAD-dependent oxidoreductase [Candidatus ainarchaeum sp.]